MTVSVLAPVAIARKAITYTCGTRPRLQHESMGRDHIFKTRVWDAKVCPTHGVGCERVSNRWCRMIYIARKAITYTCSGRDTFYVCLARDVIECSKLREVTYHIAGDAVVSSTRESM